ncbi:UvrD-helicase domain-containing protein [Pseudomonas aeruginosa]|uniref:UvrD-helicase domain-containing protein n=1 Tax=Pseudomonas aeruginosa TaxID=287 RepID=UPI00249893B1|nr:UvrD-helicase domain-containing protein [Pseudomonas aeruginosa]MDI2461869.1 UvrD-helicase domain-containing protein [Pseudomonas aeruginosa]
MNDDLTWSPAIVRSRSIVVTEEGLSKEYVWGPSFFGRILSLSAPWSLRLADGFFELDVHGERVVIRSHEVSSLQATRGLFSGQVSYPGGTVGGLPNASVSGLNAVIKDVTKAHERLREETLREAEKRTLARHERFRIAYMQIRDWLGEAARIFNDAMAQRRWVTHEQQIGLQATRPRLGIPETDLNELLQDHDLRVALSIRLEDIERVLTLWRADWSIKWREFNKEHTKRELVACEALLSKVEKRPLNDEQARAVICFDNRILVAASAGSGKTSTMVAKAAYAIDRGFFQPKEIVMLAFNKDAAKELAERAEQSFKRLKMDGVTVRAKTFHRLGLAIIGYATKKKPRVPEWVVKEPLAFKKLEELVDHLKDNSVAFRSRWDLFRLVFGRDLPDFKSMKAPPKAGTKAGRLNPIQGDPVKSLEECMIANWLHYNGVEYVYERPYEHDTATATHSQYHPDFYYPKIGLYHEHFALDEQGQPPGHFEGYLQDALWKRALHRERGTHLIETTSHQIRQNTWVEHLTHELTSRGIELDPNPDRPVPPDRQPPLSTTKLIGLIRTFIAHVKSNCLTEDELLKRVDELPMGLFKHRYRMFLDIFWPVMEAWNKALKNDGGLDFEDMLVQAAEHVEQGRCVPNFRLVMADEFQDASKARARLCRALVSVPGRHFFAVGDDWQSINRFAGADVSVMTEFREYFGSGQLLKLEQTFRCPQALCDVSSRFVSRNPVQLTKTVYSKTPAVGPALRAVMVPDADSIDHGINSFLEGLVAGLKDGTIPKADDRLIKVCILGRYNKEIKFVPGNWKARFGQFIEVSFLSVHRSKGTEADYVILPSMVSMKRGRSFPSTMTDDPVLGLVMPNGDSYPFAEERRLFYVALTRARRTVVMYTVASKVSIFIKELASDNALQVEDVQGAPVRLHPCPRCCVGDLVVQESKNGPFVRCTNFPECDYKPPKKKPVKKARYTGNRYGKKRFRV